MSRISGDLDAAAKQPSGSTKCLARRAPIDVLAIVLCALVAGLVLSAGVSVVTASDATVVGKVEGGGWGGSGCYPTVAYTVEGRDYLLHPDKDLRWCGLHWMGPATVYYQPSDPAQARLSQYGDLPWHLISIALIIAVIAAFLSTRSCPGAPPAARSGRVRVYRGRQGRVPRILVLLLILGWLVTTAAVVVQGERRSSLDDLQAAIDRGEVTHVSERGAVVSGGRDTSTVHLAWRSGGMRYFATATQYRGRYEERRAPEGAPNIIVGDLADQLSQGGADVRVQPNLRTTAPSAFSYTPWGWHVFGWLVYVSVALLLITLRVLVVAERTRGASRWGWFWLIAAAPIPFSLAYLALGEQAVWSSISGREPPKLGGVAAFLLATALAAVQQALA
jgi:hypothetical protein